MTEEHRRATGDAAPPTPRLTRSREHKVVSGVCGGLGQHVGLDPVIFRITLAVVSVIGGLGLIVYGFAWLLIPVRDEEENELSRLFSGRVEGSSLTALLCTLVGCGLFLASLSAGGPAQVFSVALAGALVGGTYWSVSRRQHVAQGTTSDTTTAPTVSDAPPEAQAPPAPAGPSWWREPVVPHQKGSETRQRWGADAAPQDGPPQRRGGGTPDPLTRRQRSLSLSVLVFSSACAVALLGTAVTWSTQPLGTSLTIGLSGALGVFGLGLVISAFMGRLGFGTVVAVILTGALLGGAAALPKSVSTTWTHTVWRPSDAAAAQRHLPLTSGHHLLDLTRLRLASHRSVRVTAELGAGALKVQAPDDVTVRLRLTIGVGGYRLPHEEPGADTSGPRAAVGTELAESTTLRPLTGEKGRGTITLRVDLGIGLIRVDQRPPVVGDVVEAGVTLGDPSTARPAATDRSSRSGGNPVDGPTDRPVRRPTEGGAR